MMTLDTAPSLQDRSPNLEIFGTFDSDEWDEPLGRFGGSIFHSAAWASYRSHRGLAEPLFCRWFMPHAHEPVALGLGFRRPGPLRLASWMEFDSPPVTKFEGGDLLTPLIDWVRGQRSVAELRLGSFDPRGTWRRDPLPEPAERLEFLVDPAPREELIRRMRRLARRSIRKAEGLGVAARLGGPGDVSAFANLYRQTLARLNQTKGVPVGSLDAAAVTGLVTTGAARLYVAEEAGAMIVGWLFGTFRGTAYSLLSGSADRALETGAVPFTLAHALGDLSDLGFGRLNLGGVNASARNPDSPDHGLYAFKAGLGAEPTMCAGGRVVCRPVRAAALVLARNLASRPIARLRR